MSEPEPTDPEAVAIVRRWQQAHVTRKANDAVKPRVAQVVQLPIWPEAVRGMPNVFLRSAIFAAVQGKTRRYLKNSLLGALGGLSVKFTGMQLDQADADIWEQLAHLARLHPLGNVCHFRGHAFLKEIGSTASARDYTRLDDTITRLVACAVEIKSGAHVYTGSLVQSAARDDVTREYAVVLDPTIIGLFRGDDWTGLEFAERLALKAKPLAKWLHGFYSSHAKPYPIKIDTLRTLSGSATKQARNFKQKLKAALPELEAASGIVGTIDGDLLIVSREPTKAQQKHLSRHKRPRK